MYKVLATLFGALLLSATSNVASADVHVSPRPKDTAIHLKATHKRPPAAHTNLNTNRSTHPTPEPDTAFHPTRNKYGGFECVDRPDGTMQCFGNGMLPPAPGDLPAVSPGQILTAVRDVGLPSLAIKIQPANATLVNFDTIFYAQPQPFSRTVTLLGYRVALRAKAVRYSWHYGDGTSQSTSIPGRPYPAKDITHTYAQPAKHLRPSVDVTYAVRYRIEGGTWQTLRQTLQANGPAVDLQVKEAVPVLAAN